MLLNSRKKALAIHHLTSYERWRRIPRPSIILPSHHRSMPNRNHSFAARDLCDTEQEEGYVGSVMAGMA